MEHFNGMPKGQMIEMTKRYREQMLQQAYALDLDLLGLEDQVIQGPGGTNKANTRAKLERARDNALAAAKAAERRLAELVPGDADE